MAKARLPSRLRRLFWKRERRQFKARVKEAVREYYLSVRQAGGLAGHLYRKVVRGYGLKQPRGSASLTAKTKPRAV